MILARDYIENVDAGCAIDKGFAHVVPQPHGGLAPVGVEGLLTEPLPDVFVALADIASLTASNKIAFSSQTSVDLGNNVIKRGSIANTGSAVGTFPVPGIKDGAPEMFPRLLFRYKL